MFKDVFLMLLYNDLSNHYKLINNLMKKSLLDLVISL